MNNQFEDVVNLQKFTTDLLSGVDSADALMEKLHLMLEDPTSDDYIPEGVLTDCDCGRDLRAHLNDLLEDPSMAAAAVLAFQRFTGVEPVDLRAFMNGLAVGVDSAEALVAKVRPMLEDPTHEKYIKPGILTDCNCPRDLREHVERILEDPKYAERVVLRASQPPMPMDDILSLLMGGLPADGLSGNGSVRVFVMGPGSEKIQ
jgi:hypothetical protein